MRPKELEKKRLAEQESSQRHRTLDQNQMQMRALIRDTTVTDPVGVILDLTGNYGRQAKKAALIHDGMSEDMAERKLDEMVADYATSGCFPTLLTVWSWRQAEDLMPLTSPTAAESLQRLKNAIRPGQAAVVVIGRHGNTYGIVELPGHGASQSA